MTEIFWISDFLYIACLKESSTQKIERENISVKYTHFSGTTQEEKHMKAAEEKKKKARHISLADKTPHPLGTV